MLTIDITCTKVIYVMYVKCKNIHVYTNHPICIIARLEKTKIYKVYCIIIVALVEDLQRFRFFFFSFIKYIHCKCIFWHIFLCFSMVYSFWKIHIHTNGIFILQIHIHTNGIFILNIHINGIFILKIHIHTNGILIQSFSLRNSGLWTW